MKKIGRFFTNPIVISLIGLVLVSLLIWFAGPHIKFGEENKAPLASEMIRLVLIMAAIVLWGLNNLRIQLMNNKNNNGLVQDIQNNNLDAQSNPATGQAAEEIAQINERFAQALATLKKLKFKGGGKNKALYELPWYIIVGPPGSGKTTALVNSGLDFPLAEKFGKGALQGVGGTRNCDWWFTNEAVLIDTAGRYTTQDSHRVVDSSAWEGFLTLLKRNRRRRPINGAIVAISLHDLLIQTEEERILNAKTIRMRLDELMDKLEIRFPVYLLFTKSDLVSGFSEFFEDLGKEERDQVWGISLPNASKPSQCPDFEFLHQELRKLSSRLYDRVLWRMHQERDVKRAAAIQGFPQQMENLNSIVETFVNQTFVQNRFQFQPYLRGVYFSSGTQDGTPIDRLMSSVAANFGFSRDAAHLPSQQGKSYFISRLFRDVIFPESELVGAAMRYEKIMRWTQRAAYVGLAGLTLLIVLVWSGSLTRNKMYISEVGSYIDKYTEEQKRTSRWSDDASAVLPALNALASASDVYNQHNHPWLSGMGLYDSRVDTEANKAYEAKLKSLLVPKLLSTLEGVIRQGDPEGDLYSTFSIYVMFNKLEHMDKKSVKEWFETHWDKTFRADTVRRDELKVHLNNLLALELQPATLNAQVVAQTRAVLLRLPVAQRVYSRIKAQSEFNERIDMRNFYSESVRTVYKMDERAIAALSIPALFTLQGYKNLDFSVDAPAVADVLNERWILADAGDKNLDFMNQDLEDISEQVKALYLADYSRIWADVYNNLHIANFNSLNELNDALTTLVDPVYSPLLSVLQVGKTNTQLTPPVLDNLADKAGASKTGKALDFIASKVDDTVVDKRFRDLILFVSESSRGPAPSEATLQRLSQLKEFVQEITMAPDAGKKSFEIAKARYQAGAANPITALRAYAKSTPEPVERWLTSIADEAWRAVLSSAHQYVNVEWKAQVYAPYAQGLAGRYPLNRASTDELALLDFSTFFKPQGTLDAFVKEFIEPFIDMRSGWNNRAVDGYALGVSSATIAQLQRAASIRNIFFRANPETPSISLELRPYSMSKDEARFTLDLGAQRLTYNHGPKFWNSVTWAGDNDARRIRIIFEDLNGVSTDSSYVGPWAWFRLMDDSELKQTAQSNIYLITFGLGAGSVDSAGKPLRAIVYEGKATSIHNPFKNDLLSLFKCPESI